MLVPGHGTAAAAGVALSGSDARSGGGAAATAAAAVARDGLAADLAGVVSVSAGPSEDGFDLEGLDLAKDVDAEVDAFIGSLDDMLLPEAVEQDLLLMV